MSTLTSPGHKVASHWDDDATRCPVGWSTVERLMCAAMSVVNMGFAVSILVGGVIRFPPPTYEPLLQATGGHVWPYGLLYLVSGLLLAPVVSSFWFRLLGAALGVVANSAFTALFLVAVLKFPDAGATAWWAYLVFSTANASLGAIMWTHRGRTRGE